MCVCTYYTCACAHTSASTQRFSLCFAYLTVIFHTIEPSFEFYKNYRVLLGSKLLKFLLQKNSVYDWVFQSLANSRSPIMQLTALARSSVVSPPCFLMASMVKTWGVAHIANAAPLTDSATQAIELEISDMPLLVVMCCSLMLSLVFQSRLLKCILRQDTGQMGGFGEKPLSCQFVWIRFEWK